MIGAASYFRLDGEPRSAVPYGNGHINVTYKVSAGDKNYILQKINTGVFRDPDGLMNNIKLVTDFLAAQDSDPRHVMRPVETIDGRLYHRDDEGVWRMLTFIEGSTCLEMPRSKTDFEMSARAFGDFQSKLSGFDASQLVETIPRFHDTVDRYRIFKEALAEDPLGRAKDVERETEFALAREEDAGIMLGMLKRGELPLKVTHNDTKLNNVLLDEKTGEPLCVIDLDTVMPGLSGNDFGDSIRFGATTGAEDERDLSKVNFSLELFEAYTRGFMSACGARLTESETETLPLASKLMTLECGVRFLTDHILGDKYFRIHRENHNLDRCRTQFRLVDDMERHFDEMSGIVNGCRR